MSRVCPSRREFLNQSSLALAGIAAAGSATAADSDPATQSPASVAKPRIRIGFIGVGGRGTHMLRKFRDNPEFEIRAVCDVRQEKIKSAISLLAAGTASDQDYRNIIHRDDLDAIFIGTPDHWHAIITIEACKAGKDVYVEKPLSLCVAEGRRMIEAARKYKRVVQMGSQQLSGAHYQQAKEYIRGDRIGKVAQVRTWFLRNRYPGLGRIPDAEPPPTLNWDLWVGPRPMVPYNELRSGPVFRYLWDYSGGNLTDWGAHHFHTVCDIMGYDPPVSVVAAGGRFLIDDVTETPDNLVVVYQFKDWMMEFVNSETNAQTTYGSDYGIEFRGTRATMFLDRKGFAIYPEKSRNTASEIVGEPGKMNLLPPGLEVAHIQNFADCIRSREFPNSDVELGHKAMLLCHLGNIAFRTGRQISWDAEKETIPGDSEAAAMLTRTYRDPYLLPEV